MSTTQKYIIPIKGMHCKSCEILVEEELKTVRGIKKAAVDHRRDQAEIYFQGKSPDLNAITKAIERAGYSVGKEEKKGWISTNKDHYKELGLAALFLLGLYYLLRGLGVTNLDIAPSSEGITVPLILLVGLVAGVSTCMALVGGLVLGLSARHNELHPEATALEKFRPHLFFNLGRVLSYMFFGGLLGLLGSIVQFSSFTLGVITIVVGLVMLIMGLQLIEIFPWAGRLKLTLPKNLARAFGMGKEKKEYSHKNALMLGALTFFLPCGFTQAMQVFAVATGSFIYGGIVMGLFALGTMPGLLGIGGLAAIVKGSFARKFFKAAGLAVIAFSVFNISNGLGLTGINLAYGQANGVNLNDPNVVIENGVQVVRMKQVGNGYSPNSFTIRQGIPVKWIITSEAPFSCAASLVMNKYNIRRNLERGENIIEFTPKETGRIPFSCSMGMYTGVFNVVDEKGQGVKGPAPKAPKASGGGCGGIGGGCGGCGGGRQVAPSAGSVKNIPSVDNSGTIQEINATYTDGDYLQPNSFKVKAGQAVKFDIDVKDSGRGCGYAIMIPGLYDNAIPLQAGEPITMEFTPGQAGSYDITCGMGMINYGTITVE